MSVSTSTIGPNTLVTPLFDLQQFSGADENAKYFALPDPSSSDRTMTLIRARKFFEHFGSLDTRETDQLPLQALEDRVSLNAPRKSSCITGLFGGAVSSLLTQHPLPFLLGLSGCFPRVLAQQKIGNEFQVNNYTNSDQMYPTVASFSNDNFVVTWASDDQEASGSEVYGQLFSDNGTKIGNEFRINNYTISSQDDPTVTSFPNGNFVVTWYSWAQDGDSIGVFGQLFDGNATKIGNEFQVNTYTNNSQWFSSVTSFPNNNFVVTWQSEGQDGSANFYYGVFGQIFDENATKIGNEFQVNNYTDNDQSYPAVTSFPNGNFVVTWDSFGQDGSLEGVYGQIFDRNATKIGNEFRVNNHTTFAQGYPAVASFPNGNFVATWESYGQDGSEDGIFEQLFDGNAGKIGNELQVNTYTGSYQSNPSVTILFNGNFVVTWACHGTRSDNLWRIFGQLFDGIAGKIGKEFQVSTFNTTYQGQSSAAPLTNGNFVVTWYSEPQDGSGAGVYGQIFHDNNTQLSSSTTTSSTSSSQTSSSTFSTTSSTSSSQSSSSSSSTTSSTSSSQTSSSSSSTTSSTSSKTTSLSTISRDSSLTTSTKSSSASSTIKSPTLKTSSESNHAMSSPPTNSRLLWLWLLLGIGSGAICFGGIGYLLRKSRNKEGKSNALATELGKMQQVDTSPAEEHYQRTPDFVTAGAENEGTEYGLTPNFVTPGSENEGTEYGLTPNFVIPGSENGTEYAFTPDHVQQE